MIPERRPPLPRSPRRGPVRLPPRIPPPQVARPSTRPLRPPIRPPLRQPPERVAAAPENPSPQELKSRGERFIAQFLNDSGIKYHYEYPIIILDEDKKQRIWYPDFWVPELSIVIEYFGMVDDEQYLELVKKKEKVYQALNINFIGVSNHMVQLEKNWEKFIIMRMIEIMDSKDPIYHKLLQLKQKYTW